MIANKQKIAITGGIGSGKSTVSAIISNLGYSLYDADKIYADIISEESVIKNASDILCIKPLFSDNGRIFFDRKKAASVLFSDKEKKRCFDEYVYPLVYRRIDDIFEKSDSSVFFEIPLLLETGRADSFDKIIIVKRNIEERIKSVKLRSNLTDGEILERIKNQIDYEKFDYNGHIVIHNDGDINALKCAVEDCIAKIFSGNN